MRIQVDAVFIVRCVAAFYIGVTLLSLAFSIGTTLPPEDAVFTAGDFIVGVLTIASIFALGYFSRDKDS